jgi:hypothetical protein
MLLRILFEISLYKAYATNWLDDDKFGLLGSWENWKYDPMLALMITLISLVHHQGPLDHFRHCKLPPIL